MKFSHVNWSSTLVALTVCLATTLITGCGDGQDSADQIKSLGAMVLNNSNQKAETFVFMTKADGGEGMGMDDASMSEAIQLLPKVSTAKTFNASNTSLSDEDLKYVGRTKSLVNIDLNNTAIGDAGVAHLTGLQKLEQLNLAGTQITGDSLASIGKLGGLRILNLAQTDIQGGYEALTGCEELGWIVLNGNTISDADAEALAQLPNLTRVEAGDAKISDSAAKTLEAKGMNVNRSDRSLMEQDDPAPSDSTETSSTE